MVMLMVVLSCGVLPVVSTAQDTLTWESFDAQTRIEEPDPQTGTVPYGFKIALGALVATLAVGFLIRSRAGRQVRVVFLLTSLVILGFVNGGCPCPISSFQNLGLYVLGVKVPLHSLVWFLGLIPLTYFFGRVWCGWICHLGALQEFLYRPSFMTIFQRPAVQRGLRILRIGVFVTLLVQLVITRTNLFREIDPFKVAFNLMSANTTGWILLGLLLLSSLVIYRPFCRGFCPVGLILGWVGRLPYAFRWSVNTFCNQCGRCQKECPAGAIGDDCEIRPEDCIACGECLDACPRQAGSGSRCRS
jgi:polyferredoxin